VSTRTNRVALEPDLGGIRRLAESFEIGLAARNLSPRTVKGYLESVRLLAEYLARSGMPTRLDSIARRLRQRVEIARHRHVPVRAPDRLPDLQCVRPPDGRRVPRLPGDAVATDRRDPPVAGVPHLSGGARPAVHRDPERWGPPGVPAWVLLEASTSSSPISQATGSTMDQGSRRRTNPRARISYAICMFTPDAPRCYRCRVGFSDLSDPTGKWTRGLGSRRPALGRRVRSVTSCSVASRRHPAAG